MEQALPLEGRRVGVVQARHARELAALIEREGGVPVLAPCMREVRVEDDAELAAALERATSPPADVFVFQTGVGVRALFELAGQAGLDARLAAAVEGALVVARGPKPLAALHQRGLRVDRRTESPHTTAELLPLLDAASVAGRRVALQHYGAANRALVDHLRGGGADVIELFSYRWALPEDLAPVRGLLDELRDGRLAVTAFTSASQVENLFTVAADAGVTDELPGWLTERTLTAAIGPTSAQALEQRGVTVAIQPAQPKMAPFVRAIAARFATSSSQTS